MNILIISRGWPTKDDPKWGCFEKDQAEALRALGHEVKVLCLDCRFSFKPYIPSIKKITINGINYYSFRGLPGVLVALIAGNKTAIKLEKWMLHRLYKYLKVEGYKPNVVYSHFVQNSAAATILKEEYDLPLVVIEHSSELVKGRLTSIIRNHAQEAYSSANQVIAVSDFLRRKIKKEFNIDSIVVPNMLGSEFLSDPLAVQKVSTGIKYLSVGALIPRKGYAELIEAFSKANLPSDWELVIIGYGRLYHKLKKTVERLRLEGHIKFLGAKNKTEIIAEMATSDAFVLNSQSETFGVVFIEALSQGLPCIATKCGGTEGIVDATDGIMVEVGNKKALIAALEYMAKHHQYYKKNDIRNKCLKRYAPMEVAKKIEMILQENVLK